MSMSSARSITAAVNPPRAVYLDYPLGRTAGKPDDPANQLEVMRATLEAFSQLGKPGIVDLPFLWQQDDAWKDKVMRPSSETAKSNSSHEDDRVQRFDTPQYQNDEDAHLAASQSECPTCVFLENEQ
ncbi:MAG: hypothetical protein AAF541_07960 [Pseudomonadota bacterium]